jgi:hypothetical protein
MYIHILRKASYPQSRQSIKLFLQSSELEPPQTRWRVYPTPLGPGGLGEYTRLRERGWGGPNSDKGTDTVILYRYIYGRRNFKDTNPLMSSSLVILFGVVKQFGRF